MIYLASPYSHPDPAERELRYKDIMHCSAHLMLKEMPIFSPILHCHPLAIAHAIPTDAKFWEQYNTAFIRKATSVYVCCLDGWEDSLGVTQEIGLAKSLFIPIVYVDVNGIPLVALSA